MPSRCLSRAAPLRARKAAAGTIVLTFPETRPEFQKHSHIARGTDASL